MTGIQVAPTPGMAPRMAQKLEQAARIKEHSQERLRSLKTDIEAIRDAAFDAKADTRAFRFARAVGEAEEGALSPTERIVLHTPVGDMNILQGAHEQFAFKLGIPWKYYLRLLAEYPDGLVEHGNHWLASEPATRLLRMMKPLTDEDRARLARTDTVASIRAFLGEGYRPLDHAEVLSKAVEVAEETGAYLTQYSLSDKTFYLRLVSDPRPIAQIVRGMDHSPVAHEQLSFGVSIRNSETGHAALAIEEFEEVLICTNGMIGQDLLSVRHVGSKQGRKADGEGEDEGWLSREAATLDDAATFLKVRDAIRRGFTAERAEKGAQRFAKAAGHAIELPADVPLFTFVERVGKRYDLTQAETEILKEEVTSDKWQRGGELTRLNLVQGVTATARRTEDFERRVELERLGWQLLDSPVERLAESVARRTN